MFGNSDWQCCHLSYSLKDLKYIMARSIYLAYIKNSSAKFPHQEGKLQNFTISSRKIMAENYPEHFLNT